MEKVGTAPTATILQGSPEPLLLPRKKKTRLVTAGPDWGCCPGRNLVAGEGFEPPTFWL